jgi:hypothetical protein
MVCWQKNEKLRRSWDDSKELALVLKGKLRDDEDVVKVFECGEWLVLECLTGGPGEYQSHVRPVVEQFLHAGLALSHLMRRILSLC